MKLSCMFYTILRDVISHRISIFVCILTWAIWAWSLCSKTIFFSSIHSQHAYKSHCLTFVLDFPSCQPRVMCSATRLFLDRRSSIEPTVWDALTFWGCCCCCCGCCTISLMLNVSLALVWLFSSPSRRELVVFDFLRSEGWELCQYLYRIRTMPPTMTSYYHQQRNTPFSSP